MLEDYIIEKADYNRVKKLRTLHNANTIYQDAARILKNCKSDHALNRYAILIEARRGELMQARATFYDD